MASESRGTFHRQHGKGTGGNHDADFRKRRKLANELCEGKVVQWPQQYGDDITNGHTHEKIVCRGVHFSFLMHNSYQQKICDQSDDNERDSPIKKC